MNAEPLTLSRRTHSLLWKEWRARRNLIGLLHVIAIGALVLGFVPAWIQGTAFLAEDWQDWLLRGWISVLILLGASFLSREEDEAARCWLFSLPISRTRIVLARFELFAAIWGWGAAIVLTLGLVFQPTPGPYDSGSKAFVRAVILSVAILPLAAAVRVHFSQVIVTFVFTATILAVSMLSLVSLLLGSPGSAFDASEVVTFGLQASLITAVLALWVVILVARTRIQELPPPARAALAILYAATVVEASYVLLLADPYELFILLTGGFGG